MAIAAQQSRSERDQEVKPNKAEPQGNAHLPPSITPEGRSRLLSRGESGVYGAAGDRLPGSRPLRFSPSPRPHLLHVRCVARIPPREREQRRGFASLSVGSERKEELFQCLMESSLLNLWCLSGG